MTGDTDFFYLIGEVVFLDYFTGEDFLAGVAKAFTTVGLTGEGFTEALAGETLFMTTSLRDDLVGDLLGERDDFLTIFSSTGATTSGCSGIENPNPNLKGVCGLDYS